MSESTGDALARHGRGRKPISFLLLALPLAASSAPVEAGPMRGRAAEMSVLQSRSADPWGVYWQTALKYRWKDVHGPRGVTLLKLSPDGTLPVSPFVEYLQWRQGLNVRRFNSFHPGIARMLRRARPSRFPPILGPPGSAPTRFPDFTPLSSSTPQFLNPPPQVPEPATGLMAALMLGMAALARRWAGRER